MLDDAVPKDKVSRIAMAGTVSVGENEAASPIEHSEISAKDDPSDWHAA